MRKLAVALSLLCAVLAARPGSAAVGVSPSLLAAAASSGAPVTVRLDGSVVALRVWPSDVLGSNTIFTTTDAAGRFHPASREPFVALAGTVVDDPSSVVRLTIADGSITGYVFTRGRWITFEPNGRRGTVVGPPATATGVAAVTGTVAPPTPLPPVSIGPAGGFGNCVLFACDRLTARIALDGDSYFRALRPSTCQSRQVAILNGVDGIYHMQPTRIHFLVTQVNCRTAADLGNKHSDAITYLVALRNAWSGNNTDRALVHLSTGFDFPDSTVGLSYLPGVCARTEPDQIGPVVITQKCSFGYGLHQAVAAPRTNYNASTFLLTKLEAHEIGHSFNAEHDPAGMCPLKPPRRGPIMCAALQELGRNVFSAQSASDIRAWAEQNLGSITGT